MFWDIAIPIITLILGLAGGFFIGVFYLRKQLEKMQSILTCFRRWRSKWATI